MRCAVLFLMCVFIFGSIYILKVKGVTRDNHFKQHHGKQLPNVFETYQGLSKIKCAQKCQARISSHGCSGANYNKQTGECGLSNDATQTMTNTITGDVVALHLLRTDCGDIGSLTNGAVSTSPNNYEGAVATYSCNVGFILTGVTQRTCIYSAGWSGTVPTCAADCGDIGSLTNGAVSTSPNNYEGAVATYNCNVGFTLTGITRRTCIDGAGWSGAAPICVTAKLGVNCTTAAALCTNIANSECTGSVCVCKSGYQDDGTTLGCKVEKSGHHH